MLRREWRSQALVTLLLAVAVTATVCGGCLLYNVPPPADPVMGTAGDVWVLKGAPSAVAADVATLKKAHGRVDVVGHTPAKVPGLTRSIDYRAASLHGTYTGHLFAIHRGRYPAGPGEAAVTSGLAELLGVRLGGTVALDGHSRRIVGIAENPSDLTDDFVLVAPSTLAPATVSVFFDGGGAGRQELATVDQRLGQGPNNDQATITTLILAGATILLLLVAFVAAAGFAVLAHRRLRQLGMLAAIGATARQVRLVMTATGLLIGTVGAVVGVAAGLALWPAAAGWAEPASGHRIDRLHLPWLLIVAVAVLAVLMATAAAWWPSRSVSRLPVTLALSGRPPARRSAHRPAVLAAVLFAVGLGCLAFGGKHNLPIIAGMLATALAILLVAPVAVRVLAALGARAPVAVRLALRDLARHQARSGAAVAALSLALGIPVVIVIVTTYVQATPTTGNLGDRQLLIRVIPPDAASPAIPVRSAAQQQELAADVGRLVAAIPGATALPLDKVYDPAAQRPGSAVRDPQALGIPINARMLATVDAYVATPELLRLAGADPDGVPAASDVVTGRTEDLVAITPPKPGPDRKPAIRTRWPATRVAGPDYSSLPDTLLTQGALARHHLVPVRAGWLVQSPRPFTSAQLGDARRIAVGAGLSIESRDGQQGVRTFRASAVAAGVLLALAVLAMTVGLIRTEAAADLRTLTATGATAGIRRTLTAATAGGLALLGAVLGTAGAGLGLVAVYRHDLSVFGRVPLIYPLIFLIGVPLAAAAVGWLLAGKEPPAIARRMSE
jgi:putative ABC transport system permease protein